MYNIPTMSTNKLLVKALITILGTSLDVRSGPAPPSTSGMGYSRGATQVCEASWRRQDSCWAVGRAEGDSLQHNRVNHHSLLEKPRDSGLSGLLGRSPFCTAITTA